MNVCVCVCVSLFQAVTTQHSIRIQMLYSSHRLEAATGGNLEQNPAHAFTKARCEYISLVKQFEFTTKHIEFVL